MWKKVRCAAVGFRVPPSGRVKKCKSGFFREARVDEEMDHVTRGGRRAVSCGSNFPRPSHGIRGDAVHLRVMLGSARLGTTLGPTPKCPTLGKKTKKKHAQTASAHSLSFTLQFFLWDLLPTTHSISIHRLGSLPCLLSPSIFSSLIFSPLYLSTNPHHIHHGTLASICCLA